MQDDVTQVEAMANALANALANADLDGPDPEDYWPHLARAALRIQADQPRSDAPEACPSDMSPGEFHERQASAEHDRLAPEAGLAGEFERWADIQDNEEALIRCGERWKAVARSVGCELHGFNDGFTASFTTPDGNVIEVGRKWRTILAALTATEQPRADVVEALQILSDAYFNPGALECDDIDDAVVDALHTVRTALRTNQAPASDDVELLREAREDTHLVAMMDPAHSADARLTGERIREAADRLARIDASLGAKP